MLLLADAAQSIGGKLYIMGGGWSQAAVPPGQGFPMALAIRITVPWSETNRRIGFRVHLRDQDGQPVDLGAGPLAQTGEFEIGRPAGVEIGAPQDAMLAVNAGTVALPAGRYVWELEVDERVRARAPFRVVNRPEATLGP